MGHVLPSESAIPRVVKDLGPADLNTNLRPWVRTRTGIIEGRTIIALDGKTMRGAGTDKSFAPHILSALDQATGAVLAQQPVVGKSSEIPAPRVLVERLDLDGVVVTADARHAHIDTAQCVHDRGGHCHLTVNGNQKTLRKDVQEPAVQETSCPLSWADTGHGKRERRALKAVEAPPGWTFPGTAQVVQGRFTRVRLPGHCSGLRFEEDRGLCDG